MNNHVIALKTTCGWCGVLLREGTTPESTGICPVCAERVMADHDMTERLQLSVKAIAVAKDAAFRDLPENEKKTYLRLAEQAVLAEADERKPS